MFVLVGILPFVYSFKALAPLFPQLLILVVMAISAVLSNAVNRSNAIATPQMSKANQMLMPIMFSATMIAIICISYVHETGWVIYASAGLFWMVGLYAIRKRITHENLKNKL